MTIEYHAFARVAFENHRPQDLEEARRAQHAHDRHEGVIRLRLVAGAGEAVAVVVVGRVLGRAEEVMEVEGLPRRKGWWWWWWWQTYVFHTTAGPRSTVTRGAAPTGRRARGQPLRAASPTGRWAGSTVTRGVAHRALGGVNRYAASPTGRWAGACQSTHSATDGRLEHTARVITTRHDEQDEEVERVPVVREEEPRPERDELRGGLFFIGRQTTHNTHTHDAKQSSESFGRSRDVRALCERASKRARAGGGGEGGRGGGRGWGGAPATASPTA